MLFTHVTTCRTTCVASSRSFACVYVCDTEHDSHGDLCLSVYLHIHTHTHTHTHTARVPRPLYTSDSHAEHDSHGDLCLSVYLHTHTHIHTHTQQQQYHGLYSSIGRVCMSG
jgi:hypothetical protein